MVVVVVVVKIGEYQKIRNVAVWVTAVVANRGRKWLKGGSEVGAAMGSDGGRLLRLGGGDEDRYA
jgi:hypothetical protein